MTSIRRSAAAIASGAVLGLGLVGCGPFGGDDDSASAYEPAAVQSCIEREDLKVRSGPVDAQSRKLLGIEKALQIPTPNDLVIVTFFASDKQARAYAKPSGDTSYDVFDTVVVSYTAESRDLERVLGCF